MKPAASSDRPWLMEEATDYLYRIIHGWIENRNDEDIVVIETGAGGSSFWFAGLVSILITFEHDPKWAAEVQRMLKPPRGCDDNVNFLFRPDYPKAGLFASGDTLPPIDIAFIDGRGRVRSVIDVLPYIKSGGWLVLDDSDRPHYAEARRVADAAASLRVVFRSGPDETTFWRIK